MTQLDRWIFARAFVMMFQILVAMISTMKPEQMSDSRFLKEFDKFIEEINEFKDELRRWEVEDSSINDSS